MKKLSKAEKKRKHQLTKGFLQMKEKVRVKRDRINKDKAWRKIILEKDNFTCQMCGATDNRLNAHHVIPKAACKGDLNKLRCDPNNGICLCVRCHHFGEKSPHANALFFHQWLKENKYEQYEYLMSYTGYENILNGKMKKRLEEDDKIRRMDFNPEGY